MGGGCRFTQAECCACIAGYVYDAAGNCVELTCLNVDGAGSPFACGAGMQVTSTASTTLTVEGCCEVMPTPATHPISTVLIRENPCSKV